MIPSALVATRPSDAPILSLYVNRNGTPAGPRIHELLRGLRTSLDTLPRSHGMSLKTDMSVVEALAPKIDRGTTPAFAAFSCHADGLLETVELGEAVWDTAMAGSTPYLRPLRAAGDQQQVGVAVVDRKNAWVFTVDHDGIEKIAQLDDEPLQHPKNPGEGLKPNYGGWQGYAEKRSRAHAGAVMHRHFQEASRLLSDLHDKHRFGGIVIGGHAETMDGFVDLLHPSIRQLVAGTFVADPRTLDRAQVRDQAWELMAEARRQRELEDVAALHDEAGAGGRAILGLSGVIFAANLSAMDRLWVAGRFEKSGSRCVDCAWLARHGDRCPACDGRMKPVGDVVGEVIEKAIRDGGSVDHVRVASRLDASGIGARLRFPIPNGI